MFKWLSISFLCLIPFINGKTIDQQQINKSKPYIVSIKSRFAVAAYSSENTVFGTGFIINVQQGLIVTNAHVVGSERVLPFLEITLHDGRELRAKIVYVDPWQDIAFLKIDPSQLKDLKKDLIIKKFPSEVSEEVYIIGKNENKHFSLQTGTIASLTETSDILPAQVFRISLNAQGGASGSPVFNSAGDVVGIVFASNGLTSAFAFPGQYITYCADFLLQQKTPARFSIGAVLKYISLDDLVRYHNFPQEMARSYQEKFPHSFNRVLCIESFLQNNENPEPSLLRVGDVITHIDNQEIGPDLLKYDDLCNQHGQSSKEILLKLIRSGKPMEIKVKAYDLLKNQIKKMISFAGVVFYEKDDFITRRTAAKPEHKVFVTNVRPGSSFYEKLPTLPRANSTSALVAITAINNQKINSLEDVERIIPSLVNHEDFIVEYVNYGVDIKIDNILLFDQTPRLVEISYNRSDGIPEKHTFKDGTWLTEPISIPGLTSFKHTPAAVS